MRVIAFVVVFLSFLGFSEVRAQSAQVILDQQMEIAKKQMASGDYEDANKTFRKILSLKTVLPSEFTYLFAETLYMVGQFENSKNFLDRYFKLTGRAGDYTEEAEQLSELLDNKISEIANCNFCDIRGYRLKTCSRCMGLKQITDQCFNCGGHGGLKCNVCFGQGVKIEKNEFNIDEYSTCPKCNGKGHVVCPVCEGKKILTQNCPTCLGSGMESSSVICDHEPHDHDH